MTVGELQWLVGIAVTVVVAIAMIAVGAFRSMAARLDRAVEHIVGRIDRDVEKLEKAIAIGDAQLHERLNRLRQDVSDNYVRRIDLDGHLAGMREQLKELRDDIKELLKQISARRRPGGTPR